MGLLFWSFLNIYTEALFIYYHDTTILSTMNKIQVTGKTLGTLESDVMEVVWQSLEPVSVKDVYGVLHKKRQIAYTTVMTIMLRLVEKGVLTRNLEGQRYLYQPKLARKQFIANAVHGIFSTAVSTLGDEALTHFIKEIQKINPKKRRELLKILNGKN